MKTLILVGNPEGRYDREYDRDLARIWVEDGKVLVRELGVEFKPFADEVRRLLDKRLANSKTPVFSMSGRTYTEKDGTVVNEDSGHFSTPEKDDFLDTLRGDPILWNITGSPIAGYMIDTGASYILED